MGKRSNFERKEKDFYSTPEEAIVPLISWLPKSSTYAEPCVGDGDLVKHLWNRNKCSANWKSDIEFGYENLSERELEDCDWIITNPPWSRHILHPMIDHFRKLRPTWLLFDADWMHTKQAKPYLPYCGRIVSVGRLKWIPESKHTGKDNCAWYLFVDKEIETVFVGR